MAYEIYKADELTHYGIRGMKWGVRRYQRKDGTLTALGRRRLERETEKAKAEARILKNRKATQDKFDKLAARQKANEDLKRELDGEKTGLMKRFKKNNHSEKPVSKPLADMTDEELRTKQARLQSQKNIMDLQRQIADMTPKQVSRREKFMESIKDTVLPAVTNTGKKLITDWFEKKGKELLGINGIDELSALKKEVDKLDLQVRAKTARDKLNGKDAESDKYADAKREADYWKNVNTAKQQKDQYERNVANDDLNRLIDKATTKTQSNTSRIDKQTKEYERTVERMLAEMEDTGWEEYYRLIDDL